MRKGDRSFLQKAIRLAKIHAKKVTRGAPAGAVLVRDGKIIGRGAYTEEGGAHAEVKALKQAGRKADGATLYSTLEPCTNFSGKRTGSCTSTIIHAGVERVVIAQRDPHPRIRGYKALRAAGISVERVTVAGTKILYDAYNKRIADRYQNRPPHVLMKTAMSLDGKIGAPDRSAIKFSSIHDSEAVDKIRSEHDAILVGGYTAVHDDPRLVVRALRHRKERVKHGLPEQPAKVAIADVVKLSTKSRFLTAGKGEKIIFTTYKTSMQQVGRLQRLATVHVMPGPRIDLREAMRILSAKHGIRKLLLEGGGNLNAGMLAAGLVDEIRVAIASIIVGGKDTPTLVDGDGFNQDKRPHLKLKKHETFGETTVLWYDVKKK